MLQNFDTFGFRGEESFRRWLLRQAENKIRDRYRFWKRKKRDSGLEEDVGETLAATGARDVSPSALHDLFTPSRHFAGREELERLEETFARLPEDSRTIIVLARIQGLGHEAIAKKMGGTVSAARTLLPGALARLATELEKG